MSNGNQINAIVTLFKSLTSVEQTNVMRALRGEMKLTETDVEMLEVTPPVGTIVDTKLDDKKGLWYFMVEGRRSTSGNYLKAFRGEWCYQSKDGTLKTQHDDEVPKGCLVLVGVSKSQHVLVGLEYNGGVTSRKGVVTDRGIKVLPKGTVQFSEHDKEAGFTKAHDYLDS